MSEEKVKELMDRYERAKTRRSYWEDLFDECYELAIPHRETFSAMVPGERRDDRIFDETAVVGTQEFCSRLQHGIVPNFARWAELQSGPEIPDDQREEIDKALDKVTEYVFEVLQNSNFSQEVHESFFDLAVSTGVLKVDEGDAANPIVFSAVPLPRVVLDTGPRDEIDFKAFRLKDKRFEVISTMYPKASLTDEMKKRALDPKAKTDILEICYRDWSRRNEHVIKTCAICVETKEIIWEEEETGVGADPILTYRWTTCSGEVYGRGPLIQALSAIKTTNLTVRLILENAQMAISGVYQMDDDGVIGPDTIQIVPGTIIPVAPGSNGLRPVESAGDFNVSQLILGDMRNNIKRALFNDMLGDPNRTPASATEVAERMADLSRRMGSAFGRLQAELVQPVLQRVIWILKKQGRIELPVVNGREVKVKSVSPLAQAQANEDIAATARWMELIGQTFGPEVLNLMIDSEQVSAYLGKKFGVPDTLIRSAADRRQLMQMMSQAMAQQQGAAPNGQAAQPSGPNIQ